MHYQLYTFSIRVPPRDWVHCTNFQRFSITLFHTLFLVVLNATARKTLSSSSDAEVAARAFQAAHVVNIVTSVLRSSFRCIAFLAKRSLDRCLYSGVSITVYLGEFDRFAADQKKQVSETCTGLGDWEGVLRTSGNSRPDYIRM